MLLNKSTVLKISQSLQNVNGSWNFFLCEGEAEKKIILSHTLMIENLKYIDYGFFFWSQLKVADRTEAFSMLPQTESPVGTFTMILPADHVEGGRVEVC